MLFASFVLARSEMNLVTTLVDFMMTMAWFSLDLSPPSCTLFNACVLNKRCCVPGRKRAPNSKMCLITRVYGNMHV